MCGSRNIQRIWSGKYGRAPHYCSFKCMTIGNRVVHGVLSVVFLIMFISILIYGINQSVGILVFMSIICFFAFIYSFAVALAGEKWNKERLTAESRNRNIRRSRTGTSYQQKTSNTRQKAELIVKPYKVLTLNSNVSCMICKLDIKVEDIIYRCPYCGCYYHKEHLDKWLREDSECPVCDYPMKAK